MASQDGRLRAKSAVVVFYGKPAPRKIPRNLFGPLRKTHTVAVALNAFVGSL